MRTGAKGLSLIKSFEGLRIDAYKDAVGVWTIGYGHTAAAGAPRRSPTRRRTCSWSSAAIARPRPGCRARRTT